jgi:hypothetical protein
MTREDLINLLMILPGQIATAETDLLAESDYLRDARRNLQVAEDRILLSKREDGSPALDGKNEGQRAAQLRTLTTPERAQVEYREQRVATAAAELRKRRDEFSAARAAARLVGPGEPPWSAALDVAA